MESAQAAKSESVEASESITLPALTAMSRTVGWTSRTDWMWLEGELGLGICWSSVIKLNDFMDALPRRNICVQAGGALGVYPAYLARRFNLVLTFEPNPASFRCLVNNVNDVANVTAFQAALSDDRGFANLICPEGYARNTGAWYIKPNGGAVSRMKLDDLGLPGLDLLMLDVEGHELFALLGAMKTIRKYRPLILLEDKPRCHRNSGVAADWLDTFCGEVGYSRQGQVNNDQLLVPQ